MATREKKLSLNRKQTANSPAPKEVVNTDTTQTTSTSGGSLTNDSTPSTKQNTPSAATSSITRKLTPKRIPANKRVTKKTKLAINLKAKIKKPIINKKIAKTVLSAQTAPPKLDNSKRKVLKNGLRDARSKKLKKKEIEAEMPVLEPIYPSNTDVEDKKVPKRRMGKKNVPSEDSKGLKKEIKVEPDDTQSVASDITDASNESTNQRQRKPRGARKTKSEPTESIEDVMSDLNYLIKADDIKKEVEEPIIESPIKSKKVLNVKALKKQQLDLLKKTILKKENIESPLNKIGPTEQKLIDMLDLNVSKLRKCESLTTKKRRHSIEKFPVSSGDNLFATLPRSMSPRSKRACRLRRSIDDKVKRSSPYTRSDSPARILRNGKHRKLRDRNILEGLPDPDRKRKRLCSDVSGQEKLSGYESDSSYSDMASLHSTDAPIKEESKAEDLAGPNMLIDTNSNNLCDEEEKKENKELDLMDVKPDINAGSDTLTVQVAPAQDEANPSEKVPDKSLILDIMKQNFNDIPVEAVAKKKQIPDKPFLLDVMKDNFKDNSNQLLTVDKVKKEDKIDENEIEEINKSEVIISNNNEDISTENIVESLSMPESEVQDTSANISESPEELALKETILQAVGLQSLKAAEEAARQKKDKPSRTDNYTGTLKTVIKINRDKKKGGRSSLKMTLQKKTTGKTDGDGQNDNEGYKIAKEGSSSWSKQHGNHSSDTADGSSEHTSDGEMASQDGAAKLLVIPEKASSFSIHPGRLCKDECSYCFGKFGLFDTPCHIAQMKSVERQNKILEAEKHLTRDSCLCDACYRHVDRKSNTPSYMNKSLKRNSLVAPGPRQNHCHVLGCGKEATNILRRKWIIKMRKSICQVINIDLDNPGLHSIPICEEHYSALEHLMVCAMCKRRLARNHIHYLGSETGDLNIALNREGIPLTLTDKPVICKLCKYFSQVILKDVNDRPENSQNFFVEYKKRLLHFNDIVPMDEAAAEEPIVVPNSKDKIIENAAQQSSTQHVKTAHQPLAQQVKRKRRKLNVNNQVIGDGKSENSGNIINGDNSNDEQDKVPLSDSPNREESPEYSVDYNTLIPAIAMDCSDDNDTNDAKQTLRNSLSRLDSIEIKAIKSSKIERTNSDVAVQRLGSNPSISVRQLFPGEEEMGLTASIEFNNVKEKTPEGWEKCTSIIQYDMETKRLWNDLQKPYGNQSSFLRHLILLEKYFRNGDLILSSNASHHSQNYSESVQNRIRAFDNIPTTMLTSQVSIRPQKSTSGIITSTPNANKESLMNNSNIFGPNISVSIPSNNSNATKNINPVATTSISKPKTSSQPPGLISLNPANNGPRLVPSTTNNKQPQSQKIKFPITKNWRPNLIPIDPNKKPERKPGLVQVISGGKPYHITLEDYKKMCAIKRSFEMKQRRIQEAKMALAAAPNQTSLLKSNALAVAASANASPAPNLSNSGLKTVTINTNSNVINPETVKEPQVQESILEKLDKQIEKLDGKVSEKKQLVLPKIPKSLTVIPQTVPRKPRSRPTSPVLMITQKTKS